MAQRASQKYPFPSVERPVKQLIKSQNLKFKHYKYNFNPSKAKGSGGSGMHLVIFTSKPVSDIKNNIHFLVNSTLIIHLYLNQFYTSQQTEKFP